MCDYSLQSVKTRDAQVGDRLVTKNFNFGTRGFGIAGSDCGTAVCVKPGTELAFDEPVRAHGIDFDNEIDRRVVTFRQRHKEQPHMHHDMVEFTDGKTVLLTYLIEAQEAVVLQLPAAPKTPEEAREQERAVFAG